MPLLIEAAQVAAAYWSYRVTSRGAWIIEIRDIRSQATLAERVYFSRASAMDRFDEIPGLLTSVLISDVGAVL